MAYEPDSRIALETRDELPETWDALSEVSSFGSSSLDRRINREIKRVLGGVPTKEAQEVLDDVLVEYIAKRAAKSLIGPGIDFWSKQKTSMSAGTTEQAGYTDRSLSLKELDKRLTAEIAALWLEVGPNLPLRPRRTGSAPHVAQAGDTGTVGGTPAFTPSPFDLPPAYGPPETTAGLA